MHDSSRKPKGTFVRREVRHILDKSGRTVLVIIRQRQAPQEIGNRHPSGGREQQIQEGDHKEVQGTEETSTQVFTPMDSDWQPSPERLDGFIRSDLYSGSREVTFTLYHPL